LCLMDNSIMIYAGCNRHGYLFGEIFQFTHGMSALVVSRSHC
jgi:hypothetical protein